MFRACLRLFKISSIPIPETQPLELVPPQEKERNPSHLSVSNHQNPPNCVESAISLPDANTFILYHLNPMNGMPMHETVLLSVTSRPCPGRAASPKVPIDPACRTFFVPLLPNNVQHDPSSITNEFSTEGKKIVCTIFIQSLKK